MPEPQFSSPAALFAARHPREHPSWELAREVAEDVHCLLHARGWVFDGQQPNDLTWFLPARDPVRVHVHPTRVRMVAEPDTRPSEVLVMTSSPYAPGGRFHAALSLQELQEQLDWLESSVMYDPAPRRS